MDEKGDAAASSEIEENSDTECSENRDDDEEENFQYNEELIRRIQCLWEVMSNLKEQLREEKELWRKEIDELCKLQYEENLKKELSIDQSVLSSTEPLSIPCSADKKSQQFLNETAMTVYEQHLVRYQDAYGTLSLHADKRQQMRRQLAAHSYKRKLMEVERMCNLELARVKQTASYLEPLNKIASEWNLPQSEKNNSTKFLSMRDLHYTDSNVTVPPPSSSPEGQSLQSAHSDIPLSINSSLAQLAVPTCDREYLHQKGESEYNSQSMMLDNNTDPDQTELCNSYCDCDELPLLMQNPMWSN